MARVAVVTGGTRGIGAEVSRALHHAGYITVANYNRNVEGAKRFNEECGIAIRAWDVSDYGQCESNLAAIATEVGTVDVLINNAGITRDAVLHRMPPEAWTEVIETNLTSCFNMCRAVIPGMRERGFGRIVNISSINGQKGQIGQTNYSAAKAGMIGFTKALALENARKGVTVNCIAPGYIDTEMVGAMDEKVLAGIIAQIPVGRLGKGEEIADMVSWLAGERAGYVTGCTLSLNGGQYLVG